MVDYRLESGQPQLDPCYAARARRWTPFQPSLGRVVRHGAMKTLHIDTDMGVDDALAIAVATRLAEVRVAALSTVFGNVPRDVATRNARLMRRLLAPRLDVPILVGAAEARSPGHRDARAVHGDDGLGGATASLDAGLLAEADLPLSGDGDLAQRIAEGRHPLKSDDKVTVIGLGPATNIPALAAWYGSALSDIVLMSGAFFDCGNVTDAAEFNAYCDPDALGETLALAVPITIVPLDLCRKVVLTRGTIAGWSFVEPTPIMQFLASAHRHYADVCWNTAGVDGCFPHDTLAVLAAHHPAGFFSLGGDVQVERSGLARGRTQLRAGNEKIKVLTGGDLAWVRRSLGSLRF